MNKFERYKIAHKRTPHELMKVIFAVLSLLTRYKVETKGLLKIIVCPIKTIER